MKTQSVNPNNLFWRLARTYGPISEGDVYFDRIDTCKYIRSVIFGLVAVLLIIIAGGVISVPFADFGAWVVAVHNFGWAAVDMEAPALILTYAVAAVSGLGIIFGLAWLATLVHEKHEEKHAGDPPKEPGMIKTAYQSWKYKFCVPVRINGARSQSVLDAERRQQASDETDNQGAYP